MLEFDGIKQIVIKQGVEDETFFKQISDIFRINSKSTFSSCPG
jgi:hypothetical protein